MKILDVVILAGGKGTRLSEETAIKPKPMVMIGNKPILWHIIKSYQKYKFNNFIIAGGYKYSQIKDYFKKNQINNAKITVVNTGLETQTGGRIYKIRKYLNGQKFLMTYGDGLSNVNLKKTIKLHLKYNKLATVTAVKPPARWGIINISNNHVVNFQEKNKKREDWINGGFFIIDKNIFKIFKFNNKTIFERDILEKLVKKKQLTVFKHEGFWQCMDTLREKKILNKLYKTNPLWL
tara:strand:- start:9065 stop:9772 length:708 start_codon:yes stop_codon:yes gene_type:complete